MRSMYMYMLKSIIHVDIAGHDCSAHVGETNKLIKLIKLLQIKVMIKFNPDKAGYDKMFHIPVPGISYIILCM